MNRKAVLQYATAGVTAFAFSPKRAEGAEISLRVGSNLGEPYSEGYFAQELGYFASRSLAVSLPIFAQGGTMAAAVASGDLDVAITTPVGVATAVSHGVPFVIVAAGAVSTEAAPVTPVVVAGSSIIRGPGDLIAKTVAVNGLRASSELALDAWLARGGVDVGQVRPIELSFGEMGPALARGTIAAALIGEPSLTLAKRADGVRVLANPYTAIAPDCLTSCWFTTAQFARNNPDAVQRFAAAIYEAGAWANAHHPESALLLAKVAKLDVNLIRSMTRTHYAEQIDPGVVLQPLLDAALKFGFLKQPVSASSLMFKTAQAS